MIGIICHLFVASDWCDHWCWRNPPCFFCFCFVFLFSLRCLFVLFCFSTLDHWRDHRHWRQPPRLFCLRFVREQQPGEGLGPELLHEAQAQLRGRIKHLLHSKRKRSSQSEGQASRYSVSRLMWSWLNVIMAYVIMVNVIIQLMWFFSEISKPHVAFFTVSLPKNLFI